MVKFRMLAEDNLLEKMQQDREWIKKVQKEVGCKITIKKKPPKGMRERVVVVDAHTIKGGKEGISQILRKLADINEDGSEEFSRKFCSDEVECCLLLQKELTGAVIGEKGCRLKDILKKHDVRCDIERQCVGQSDEKTVRVVGNTEDVCQTISTMLANVCECGKSMTPRYPYDPFYGGPGAVAPPSFRRHGVGEEWSKGDWLCQGCYYKNFSRNSKCKKCGGSKPNYDLDRGVDYRYKKMGYDGYGPERRKKKLPHGAAYHYEGSAGAYGGYMGGYGGGRKGEHKGKYPDKYEDAYGSGYSHQSYTGW